MYINPMIVNLTQHKLTTAQRVAGAVELDVPSHKLRTIEKPDGKGGTLYRNERKEDYLTFHIPPKPSWIVHNAGALCRMAIDHRWASDQPKWALLGGAPYLMSVLEKLLVSQHIQPVYAFTRRESVETVDSDGTVTKTSKFAFGGWVKLP